MGQADGKPEPIGILGFIGGQGHIWFVANLAKRDLADIRCVAEAQKFGLEAAVDKGCRRKMLPVRKTMVFFPEAGPG